MSTEAEQLLKIGIKPPQSPDELRRRTIVNASDLRRLGVLVGIDYFEGEIAGRRVELVAIGQLLSHVYAAELPAGEVVIVGQPAIVAGVERRSYGCGRLLPAGTWQRLSDQYEQATGHRPPSHTAVEIVRLTW